MGKFFSNDAVVHHALVGGLGAILLLVDKYDWAAMTMFIIAIVEYISNVHQRKEIWFWRFTPKDNSVTAHLFGWVTVFSWMANMKQNPSHGLMVVIIVSFLAMIGFFILALSQSADIKHRDLFWPQRRK